MRLQLVVGSVALQLIDPFVTRTLPVKGGFPGSSAPPAVSATVKVAGWPTVEGEGTPPAIATCVMGPTNTMTGADVLEA